MNHESFFSLLVAQCFQVTIVAISVFVITRFLSKRRPHLSHALWCLVLLKCLTPPILYSPIGIFSAGPSELVQHDTKSDQIASKQWTGEDASFRVHDVKFADDKGASQGLEIKLNLDDSRAVAVKSIDWTSLAIWCYAIGCVALLTSMVIRYRLFVRELYHAEKIDAPQTNELVRQLCQKMGLRRQVRLQVTTTNIGPAVYGLLRPTIVLPAVLVRGRIIQDLEPLLAHELVHIRRGDLWWAMIQVLAKSVAWFHPLVWLSSRMLACESEHCCDLETLATVRCSPAEYARSLLAVLEFKSQLRVPGALPGVRPVDITKNRMERIMRYRQGSHLLSKWPTLLVMVLGAIVVLPGMKATIGQEAPATEPTPQAKGEWTTKPQVVELVVADYDVAKVLEKLKDSGVPEQTLELALIGDVIAHLGESEFRGLAPIQARDAADQNHLPSMKLVAGKLTVRAKAESQRRVHEIIEERAKYGYDQISIETRLIDMQPATLDKLDQVWAYVDANAGVGEFERADAAANAREWEDMVKKVDVNEMFGGVSKDLPVHLQMASDRQTPYFYTVISKAKAVEFLNAAQQDSRTNVMQSPKITTFNGSKASIRDGAIEGFLRFENAVITASTNTQALFTPTIDIVPSGTRLAFRATIEEESAVALNWSRRVYDVTKSSGQVYVSDAKGALSYDTPDSKCQLQQGNVKLPAGSSLLVCNNLSQNPEKNHRIQLILITCQILDAKLVDQAPVSITPPTAGETQSIPDLVQAQPTTQKREDKPSLVIRSEKVASNRDYTPLISAIDSSFGEPIRVEGDVEYEIGPTRIRVYGKSLCLEMGEEGSIRANEMEFVIAKFEERVQMHMRGDVRVKREETHLTASELVITNNSFELSGNASLDNKKSGLAVRADRISIEDFSPESYKAQGNVKIRSKRGDFEAGGDAIISVGEEEGEHRIKAVSPFNFDVGVQR